MTDGDGAQLERAQGLAEDHEREELLKRAADDPDFSATALVLTDSPDGTASFVDVSLAHITRTA